MVTFNVEYVSNVSHVRNQVCHIQDVDVSCILLVVWLFIVIIVPNDHLHLLHHHHHQILNLTFVESNFASSPTKVIYKLLNLTIQLNLNYISHHMDTYELRLLISPENLHGNSWRLIEVLQQVLVLISYLVRFVSMILPKVVNNKDLYL